MKTTFLLALLVVCLYSGYALSQGFESFTAESEKATKQLRCRNAGITPPSFGMGALYGCIQGRAQTVKWFINEVPNSNQVKNVKLMWNDWFKDTGRGMHADRRQAEKALNTLIKLYAPQKGKELKKAFWGKTTKTIKTEVFKLHYTYSRGSAIDGRVLVVTEK